MKTHERQTKKRTHNKEKKRQRDQERIGEEPENKTAQKELTGWERPERRKKNTMKEG